MRLESLRCQRGALPVPGPRCRFAVHRHGDDLVEHRRVGRCDGEVGDDRHRDPVGLPVALTQAHPHRGARPAPGRWRSYACRGAPSRRGGRRRPCRRCGDRGGRVGCAAIARAARAAPGQQQPDAAPHGGGPKARSRGHQLTVCDADRYADGQTPCRGHEPCPGKQLPARSRPRWPGPGLHRQQRDDAERRDDRDLGRRTRRPTG